MRAEGEHIKFNKTTERKSSQRKTSSFYEKRRLDINQKVENDSQITIHRTHVKIELTHIDPIYYRINFTNYAIHIRFR